jgi:hypothetical protein
MEGGIGVNGVLSLAGLAGDCRGECCTASAENKTDGYGEWTETQHQIAFFRWVDGQIANGQTQYVTLGAVPNGHGQIGGVTLRGYKTLGFRVGMPDIYWYLPRGQYHGLFIELKTIRRLSSPTEEQMLMRRVLEKNGYRVEFCRGFKNAIAAVKKYYVTTASGTP